MNKKLLLRPLTAFAFLIAMGTFAACATPRPTIDTDALAAEAEASMPPRVVITVQTPRHVMASIKSVEGLRALTPPVEDIRVLVFGEAIHKLTQDSEWREEIEQSLADGVHITACGMAMERLGIDPATLIPGIDQVPHVFVEGARLQQLGWIALDF